MEAPKDHYSILGVLPSAEDVVIRAAYRALAQQHHPDCCSGDKEEAHRRMSEINSAYSVLKCSTARSEYDQARCSTPQRDSMFFNKDSFTSSSGFDPLDEDWELATKFYDDLPGLEDWLGNISWGLAHSFRAILLEEKSFEDRVAIAQNLEHQFFAYYFGSNEKIISFARRLVRDGKHEIAVELSRTIQVLGEGIEPKRLLSKFRLEPEPPSEPIFRPKYGAKKKRR